MRWEVLQPDEVGLDGMAVGGQVVEQTAELQQVIPAGFVAQRRILFAQPSEPSEHMGVAAKLGKAADLRKGGLEVLQEPAGHVSVVVDGARPQGEGEGLEVILEDLVETGWGLAHGICGGDKRVRVATARAYSRQTSWGAS